VVELGVVIAAIGLALAIIGMLVPTAPPQLANLGWVLLAIGLVLIVVALVLNGVDAHDHAKASWSLHARSSWGKYAMLLMVPGLRRRLRASWGGPEA
jgi:hypothetical protein